MSGWLFASLRGYRIGWLPRDLVAGLMRLAIAPLRIFDQPGAMAPFLAVASTFGGKV